MNSIQNGWFSELGTLWPGQAMSLKVEKVLFEGKSEFQSVLAFESSTYGNVLVLDGVIQATERDEFSYQEMLAHLALCSHSNPKRVLVIGGGDGGVLREIAKHACVEKIVICEIDELVIETSKRFLPSMAAGFDDPRVTVHIGDGCAYMQARKGEFDVIIVDSSDPVGPAQSLFEKPFYQYMHDALTESGIACTQAENMWLHLDLIKNLLTISKQLFAHAEYAYTMIPTYPGGQIGLLLASKGDSCVVPKRQLTSSSLKYYNAAIHSAAFVLPEFARLL